MIKVTRNLNGLKRLLNKVPERVTAKVGIIDNPDVARYAVFNEYGWVQRVTGAQSLFLSGALACILQVPNQTSPNRQPKAAD